MDPSLLFYPYIMIKYSLNTIKSFQQYPVCKLLRKHRKSIFKHGLWNFKSSKLCNNGINFHSHIVGKTFLSSISLGNKQHNSEACILNNYSQLQEKQEKQNKICHEWESNPRTKQSSDCELPALPTAPLGNLSTALSVKANSTSTILPIASSVNANNTSIIPSAPDGHCFLHSIVTALTYEGYSNYCVSTNVLCDLIYSEVLNNLNVYTAFCLTNDIIHQMNNYILHKIYNTDFGDIVPLIISNAISFPLRIYDNSYTCQHEILPNNNNIHRNTVINVRLCNEHYDAIVLTDTTRGTCSPAVKAQKTLLVRPVSSKESGVSAPRRRIQPDNRREELLPTTDLRTAIRDREANQHAPAPAHITIASFNTRTLTKNYRLQELTKLAKEQGFEVVAIQEHRRTLNTPTTIIDVGDGWQFYLSTATDGGHGGVGFLLSPKANTSLLQFDSSHHRLASISLQLKDNKLNIMNCYMPTACAPNLLEVTTCVDIISQYISNQASRDITLIVGDLNADLPQDGDTIKNRHSYHQHVSPHTTIIHDFVVSNELAAANGCMRQKRSHLLTFHGPRNRKCRLDYILLNKKRMRLIKKCRTINPTSIRSDHALISCTLSLKLWRPTQHTRKPPSLHWQALKNEDLRFRFTKEALRKHNTQDGYDAYTQAVHQAANTVLPTKLKQSNSCLWDNDPEIACARKELARVRTRQPFQTRIAEQNLEDTYNRRRNEIIIEIADNINQHQEAGKNQLVWKYIDILTERKKKPHAYISADSIKDRIDKIQSHYCNILNARTDTSKLSPLVDLPHAPEIKTDDITITELDNACKITPNGKSAGTDNIPSDVINVLPISRLLLPIMNSVLAGGEPPKEWRQSIIVSIPKKGNNSSLSNQRGLSLMSVNAKLFNKILLIRLRERMEEIILPLQAGFRPNRGTTEQILSLKIIIDSCKSKKINSVIVFVDFSKAFDCVDRSALKTILKFYNIPESFINAIMSLYTDTYAYVRTTYGNSTNFQTTSGVLQGDTLAPYLFVIVMDYVMRKSMLDDDAFIYRRRLSSRHPAIVIPALAYADDAALLSNTAAGAQRQLHRFEAASAEVGLHLNANKTEVMYIGDIPKTNINTTAGKTLKISDDFCYLGCQVNNSQTAFQKRRQLAWIAARKLTKIWNSPVSDKAKIQLFIASIESVLLYSTEALTFTDTLTKELDASHRALLRFCLGVHYPHTISNEDLRTRTNVIAASRKVRTKRLQLYGHAIRRPNLPIALLLKHKPTEPFRQGGHLRLMYHTQLQEDLRSLDMNESTAANAALNRKDWRARLKRL